MSKHKYFSSLICRHTSLNQRRVIISLCLYVLTLHAKYIAAPANHLLEIIGQRSSLQQRRAIMSLCIYKLTWREACSGIFKKCLLVLALFLVIVLVIYKIKPPKTPLETASVSSIENPAPKTEPEQVSYWRDNQLSSSESISNLLVRLGAGTKEVNAFIKNNPISAKLTSISAGTRISAKLNASGNLFAVQFLENKNNGERELISVEQRKGKWQISNDPVNEQTIPTTRDITIKTSAASDLSQANLPVGVTAQLYDIFSQRLKMEDLSAGDHIKLIYKIHMYKGGVIAAGKIQAVQITHNTKNYDAYSFSFDGTNNAFYDENGKPLKTGFSRQPIAGARISSDFGLGINPALHTIKMHDGIDFNAPTGTPVVAPSDGKVIDIQQTTYGYGNMIKLEHSQSIESVYGQLSGFRHNLHIGQKIRAGDLIGYVGSSGLASSPHLHFEIRRDGYPIDPETSAMPAHKLSKQELEAFQTKKSIFLAELDLQQPSTSIAK